eukprot:TRINITY_DN26921_c0_g2_i1.p1 TRINITY_DN26921_c0_g2~~TRINITY_DN26921_c0_g2_i1.p1  ORF type:complete len:280 (+),score=54.95 TRINITY_DN26921_c0_g2_i1:94-840(+)
MPSSGFRVHPVPIGLSDLAEAFRATANSAPSSAAAPPERSGEPCRTCGVTLAGNRRSIGQHRRHCRGGTWRRQALYKSGIIQKFANGHRRLCNGRPKLSTLASTLLYGQSPESGRGYLEVQEAVLSGGVTFHPGGGRPPGVLGHTLPPSGDRLEAALPYVVSGVADLRAQLHLQAVLPATAPPVVGLGRGAHARASGLLPRVPGAVVGRRRQERVPLMTAAITLAPRCATSAAAPPTWERHCERPWRR